MRSKSPSPISRRTFLAHGGRLATAAPFLSILGCDGTAGPADRIMLTGRTMGTGFRVVAAGFPNGADSRDLAAGVERILEGVNARMSVHRPDSELSRFNAAPAGRWVPVSGDTREVAARALEIGRFSGGAFDVTVGPLVELWGFGPGGPAADAPPPGRIAAAAAHTGYGGLSIRDTPSALRKADAGLRVNLSGIAKGYAVDRVAAFLGRRGAADYLVEIGGEVRVAGHGRLGAWRIGIEKPVPDRRTAYRVVRLRDEAIATSGDYRIFFEKDGRRYPHIIDPRSAMPVVHRLASVTVIARTTMDADAWSTALMTLGPYEGYALASRRGLAAFFIERNGSGFNDRPTPAFRSYMVG